MLVECRPGARWAPVPPACIAGDAAFIAYSRRACRNGDWFDGAKTYKVTLPKGIPAEAFWSFTLYDNQTRSMLQTPQNYPRAGSQNYPSPAAEAAEDGSITVWFAPEQPEGVARANWIQTDPDKGWVTLLRLYRPLAPFFDKSWQPSEIEPVE